MCVKVAYVNFNNKRRYDDGIRTFTGNSPGHLSPFPAGHFRRVVPSYNSLGCQLDVIAHGLIVFILVFTTGTTVFIHVDEYM